MASPEMGPNAEREINSVHDVAGNGCRKLLSAQAAANTRKIPKIIAPKAPTKRFPHTDRNSGLSRLSARLSAHSGLGAKGGTNIAAKKIGLHQTHTVTP